MNLMNALKNGYENIVKLLLEKDDYDIMNLIEAVKIGCEYKVKLLLERDDCDVNMTDTCGCFPLIWVLDDHVNIAKLLLENDNCDINKQNIYGETALIHASQRNYEKRLVSCKFF